jgi:hypothetical protein
MSYEFSNTNEATIGINVTNTFTLSIDAKVSGGIQDSWLGGDAGGSVGTELTYQVGSSVSDNIPYEAAYSTGLSIKVQDTSGNYIIYKQPSTYSGMLGLYSASEYLTETQALSLGATYVPILAGGYSGDEITVSGVINLSTQVSATVMGLTLGTEAGVSGGNQQTTHIGIRNPNSFTQCFLVLQQASVAHVWLYSNTTCP